MKNPILYIVVIATVFGCMDNHDPLVQTGSFNIAFQDNDLLHGSGLSLAGASSVFLTIKDNQQNIIIDKEISLSKLNNEYFTESIPLNEGNYTLSGFLVLDDKGSVIYGTPIQGFRDTDLVNDALPLSFAITHGKVTSLPLGVISLKSRTGKDIGYDVSFKMYKCALSATVDDHALCYEDSRFLIAYASVAGEPSVFSLTTPHIRKSDKDYYQIVVETTEFTGPGTYTIRKYDGGYERSTYGYFFNASIDDKQLKEYNSVSGTLVVESVKHIQGTSNGLATGTFAMTVKDDQGKAINITGSFNGLRGMGWWED